jgi:hypothetical protein
MVNAHVFRLSALGLFLASFFQLPRSKVLGRPLGPVYSNVSASLTKGINASSDV